MASLDEMLAVALAHHQAGRFAEAEALYRQVLDASPDHAEALHLLGVLAHQLGAHVPAAELIERAVAIDPTAVRYHNNLGTVYRALRRPHDAAASYRRAIALKPQFAEAQGNLGLVLEEAGDLDGAEAALRRALALQPQFPEALYNLGNVQKRRGEVAAAIESYRQALALAPDFVDALGNLGAALFEADDIPAAADCYRRMLALGPTNPVAHNNLANVLVAAGDLGSAIDHYNRALALDPAYVSASANLGNALVEADDRPAATAAYDRALALAPDDPTARWGKALLRLLEGDFAAGWLLHEARWQAPGRRLARNFAEPQWRGEPLEGARILLHAEQGLGDTMQFVRYVPLVAARGGQVVLEVPPELLTLLSDTPGAAEVIPWGDPHDAVDWQCPLMSLPLAFGTDVTTIPADIPYIAADPARVARWQDRLAGFPGRRIGLVWAGRPSHKRDALRSLPLSALAPLAGTSGISFFSLQKGSAAGELTSAPGGLNIIDLAGGLDDFTDTAAALSALDLVITVDTAVAHLAGALGRPVWLLLSRVPDWRWLLGRSDSPWYPTARLFRQASRGDWSGVAVAVAAALRA